VPERPLVLSDAPSDSDDRVDVDGGDLVSRKFLDMRRKGRALYNLMFASGFLKDFMRENQKLEGKSRF